MLRCSKSWIQLEIFTEEICMVFSEDDALLDRDN